jgi:outer membrane protein assembly factor BamB
MKKKWMLAACVLLSPFAALSSPSLLALQGPKAESALNWPQWRGAARDGRVAVTPPSAWAAKPVEVWKQSVGIGHASPIVADGRVYQFARQGEQETVSALDLNTGKVLWTQGYAAPYTVNSAAASHGKGPKSTPVLHAGKIYTLGISGVLSCFDASTGAVKWRKSFEKEFRATSPDYGTSMSPIVDSNLLIAHVGGKDSGALRAFDLETGQTKWSWTEDGPGYASPLVIDVAGTRQIVTQTQKFIVGIAVANGASLWRQPFTTDWDQNIVTPVTYRDTVIFSGQNKGTFALRIAKQGAAWNATKVWENPDVSMYMNSPVIDGDTLFGLTDRNKGQFFALDAASGKTRWTSPPRQGENAAILVAGKQLFMLTTDANLVIADAASPSYKPLKTFEVATSPTWAHPVLLGDRLLVKDQQSLALLSLRAQ